MSEVFQIIGFSLIFIQIDKITNDQGIRFVVLLFLILVSFKQYFKVNRNLRVNTINRLYLYFIAIIVLGIFRSSHYSVTTLNIIYRVSLFLCSSFFIYSSIYYNILFKKKGIVNQLNSFIVLPVGIYVLLNLLLWSLDVKISTFEVVSYVSDAVMLSNLGIHMPRVMFPLAGGFNTYGDFLGMYALITLVIVLKNQLRVNSVLGMIGLGISMLSLLLVDSRSFTFNALICCTIVLILDKWDKIKILKYSQLITFLTPLLISILIPLIVSNNLGGFNLSRTEESDGPFERIIIWTMSLQKLSNFDLETLVGYGEYGHFGSGASKLWAGLFTSWTDSEYISPHNTLLSTVFDYGVIGIVLYFIIIQRSIVRSIQLRKTNALLSLIALAFWLNFFVSGASETLNGFYSGGVIYLFEIIIIMVDCEYFKMNLLSMQNRIK